MGRWAAELIWRLRGGFVVLNRYLEPLAIQASQWLGHDSGKRGLELLTLSLLGISTSARGTNTQVGLVTHQDG
ncbi:hypothetical protein F5144DRAFT_580946 [Chaetomium tenue]|uniref:Uncharacterized protein n=1 Tax=Chaetomium tenue TaxID=1854479 RepID=A0ACB7NWS2_9PEZI|nr:hypothetical protein F5144DRAFT_580946 [Chaetomium globosum]